MWRKLLDHLSTLLLLGALCGLTYLSFRAELGVRYFLAVSLAAAVAGLIGRDNPSDNAMPITNH